MGQDAAPVDGVSRGEEVPSLGQVRPELLVGKEDLHSRLGVVKVAVDGADSHVVPLLGLHLQSLDLRHAVLGIEHQDLGPVHILKALQGRLAGVAGGRHQDANRLLLPVLPQGGRQQVGQDLQGHVLKGRGGAVPQLQAVGVVVQAVERGHPVVVELLGRVAGLGEGRQLLLGKVLQEELHHRHGPLAIGLAPQVLQQLASELGEDLGGQQAAVPGQPLGNGLAGGQVNRLISRAYIIHSIHTSKQEIAVPPQRNSIRQGANLLSSHYIISKRVLPVINIGPSGGLALGGVDFNYVKTGLEVGGVLH